MQHFKDFTIFFLKLMRLIEIKLNDCILTFKKVTFTNTETVKYAVL